MFYDSTWKKIFCSKNWLPIPPPPFPYGPDYIVFIFAHNFGMEKKKQRQFDKTNYFLFLSSLLSFSSKEKATTFEVFLNLF